MFQACQLGNVQKVTTLLKNGYNPNQVNDNFWESGWTPIRYAALSGFKWEPKGEPLEKRNTKAKKLIEVLLQYGANINKQDDMGITTLMSAVQFEDRRDIVQMLLQRGADETIVDSFGRTYKDY